MAARPAADRSSEKLSMDSSISRDDRLWAMLSYVLAFFFPIVAPLIIFLVQRPRSRFVAFHALQALFVQLGIGALGIVVGAASGVLSFLGPLALLIVVLGL